MIKGIGIDIVEIARIADILNRHPRFVNKVLTDTEQLTFYSLKPPRQTEWFAGRFAAKEAFAKACGSGIGQKLSFQNICTNIDEAGQPIIIHENFNNIYLTISHSKEYAVANVIITQ